MLLNSLNSTHEKTLLTVVLKGVSRSFYLSIRVLPSSIRDPVAVAYLLARAADTIADSNVVDENKKKQLLLDFQRLIEADISEPNNWPEFNDQLLGQHQHEQEARLLSLLSQLFVLLNQQAQRLEIVNVVKTLVDGMLFDMERFSNTTAGTITALESREELDRYTYLIAGCVGEFWTNICGKEDLSDTDLSSQIDRGIALGKALQLTNILRDLPRDIKIGRCYIPRDVLSENGISVQELTAIDNSENVMPVVHQLIDQACAKYKQGIQYCLTIPRSSFRYRLAALWPLLIGLKTLKKIADVTNYLDPDKVVKISRNAVYRMIILSLVCAASNTCIRHWHDRLQASIQKSLL
ncbi:MAG: squalene/phytoene synthase family protein [Gammaproteobacteria bacterium]|nr:squalene/phytoene synthase family protein [Gammaproteobacteria bacterium]